MYGSVHMCIAQFGDGGFLECRCKLRPELAAQIFKKTSKGSRFVLVFIIRGVLVLFFFHFALVHRRFVNGETDAVLWV
ncbi:hypothetical protein J3E69DRAFT_346329 [Trichoderma sp. SZMC 28015]